MTYTLPITKTMLEKAKKKAGGIIITVDGLPSAVLMSMEEYREYEALKETEEILNNPQLMKDIQEAEEDIKAGRVYDWENVKKELGWHVSDSNNTKGKKKT